MGTVTEYLTEEKSELLTYGREVAKTLRDQAEAAGDDFAKEMYVFWKDYYKSLIDVSDKLLGYDAKTKRRALKKENRVLKEAMSELDALLGDPATSLPAKRQLRTLKELLDIEKKTNNELRKAAGP